MSVEIDAGAGAPLAGDLGLPEEAHGLVVFAHGSGSGRHSPRNRFVAHELERRGLGTLLLDLLTEDEGRAEERGAQLRFDVERLAGRLAAALRWAASDERVRSLPLGLFGASTGAAAALLAAANQPGSVRAVVSRGGRPDLAGDALERVRAPTLLVVGALDEVVIGLNREALTALGTVKRLEIVPGASHLFEEPGALERVSELAAAWFLEHLR